MVVVAVYLALIVLACTLARLLWQFEAVRRLDDRVLGKRGIAAVASMAAVLMVAATAVTLVQRLWGVAAAYALMSCWVGYWAFRRVSQLRRGPRG